MAEQPRPDVSTHADKDLRRRTVLASNISFDVRAEAEHVIALRRKAAMEADPFTLNKSLVIGGPRGGAMVAPSEMSSLELWKSSDSARKVLDQVGNSRVQSNLARDLLEGLLKWLRSPGVDTANARQRGIDVRESFRSDVAFGAKDPAALQAFQRRIWDEVERIPQSGGKAVRKNDQAALENMRQAFIGLCGGETGAAHKLTEYSFA